MTSTNTGSFTLDAGLIRSSFSRAASSYDQYASLQRTVAERLVEAFDGLLVKPERILDLGSGTGAGATLLNPLFPKATLLQLDISERMLTTAKQRSPRFFSKQRFLAADANYLPLQDNCVDIVFSNLMLQWCQDLDHVFAEIQRVLKQDGLFIFSSFGPDTLTELRQSWSAVDNDVHVNAFIDMHDVGDAMLRNGLQSPVLSVETITLTYSDANQLMRELKYIGAQNFNKGRKKTLTGKGRLQHLLAEYEKFRSDGKLPATYEVIYGHAWSAAARQKSDVQQQAISVDALKQSLRERKK